MLIACTILITLHIIHVRVHASFFTTLRTSRGDGEMNGQPDKRKPLLRILSRSPAIRDSRARNGAEAFLWTSGTIFPRRHVEPPLRVIRA